jgi:NAD(P)H-dependent FMN reductase
MAGADHVGDVRYKTELRFSERFWGYTRYIDTRSMSRDVRVVALCGSLRAGSKTRVALREALVAAEATGRSHAGPDASVWTDLLDLRQYDLPALAPDDPTPDDAVALCRAVPRADAVLLGTPNYHGSYSGVLKNALDYCGREELEGTTVGLLEVAGGEFPNPTLAHLRAVCHTLNSWTLPTEVAVPDSHSTVDADGISDEAVGDRVRRLGEQRVAYANVDHYPKAADVFAGPLEVGE